MGVAEQDPIERMVQEALQSDNPPSIEQLIRERHTDELTGLLDRRWLNKNFPDILEAHHGDVGLLFIDLDGFKEINDTHGHEAGDRHLKETATRLRQSTDGACGDAVVRLGGDEFLIVLPGIHDERGLLTVSHRIQEALDKIGSGGSIGSVLHEGEDAVEFIDKADQAMNAMKEQRKLENLTPQELEAYRRIGEIATTEGISLRDAPLVLKALHKRSLHLE